MKERSEEDTYALKFYEAVVQAIVERNRAMFEPDAEEVIEALEWLRNNHDSNIGSFDCINDQENEDMQLDTEQELSVEDSFSKQSPADFGLECKSISSNKNGISLIMQNQPTEVSDDGLRELIRSLTNEQRL